MSELLDEGRAALEGTACTDGMHDFFRVGLVRGLVSEIERLHRAQAAREGG